MLNTMKKQSVYYLLLGIVLLSGFLLFISFTESPQLQMVTVILTSFFYVGFALFQHYLTRDLTVKVVIEYVLIAALGITIVFFYLT